jgi:hypothetical protein
LLTTQEINTYNKLSEKGFVQKITCPFDTSDIIVTRVDSSGTPFFYCLTCSSSFSVGLNTEGKIKKGIKDFSGRE